MSSVRVRVYGNKLDLADELAEEFHAEAKPIVAEGRDMLLSRVQQLLTRRRGTAQTVAPVGEPPEVDTFELVNSWKPTPVTVRRDSVRAGIRSNLLGKVLRLEYGGTDSRGIRTLPRPFLRPAIAEMDGPIGRLFEELL
jgi:hypothetical protein